MGQPAVVNLFYGFFAMALAKLTDGMVYSDDGAWEYKKFPILFDKFQKLYLNYEKLQDKNLKEWLLKSEEELKRNLKNI